MCEAEREHMNNLLRRSGVRTQLNLKLNADSEYEKNKKRWIVVQGIINDGNDSKQLKDEAKTLLKYFLESKTISKSEYNESIKQLD